MDCKAIEEKLALYFYEEVTGEERAAVDAHLGACARCAAAADELRRMKAVLDQRSPREPSPELLVHCRQALEEGLDREASGWRGQLQNWFGLSPGPVALRGTTVLGVLVLGFSLGWTLHRQTALPGAGDNGPQPWIAADLENARISGISQVVPDPRTGDVRITLNAERRLTLEGSLDDPRIQKVLLYAVKSYDNPGIRHDTLEVLRARGENPAVRDALIYVMRNDPNDGVRLEALQALRGLAWTRQVGHAFLGALEQDTNPGMRVAAINALVQHADEEFLPRFEKLATEDNNPYVRLKCARAVRELAREEH